MLPSVFNTCIPRAEIQAGELWQNPTEWIPIIHTHHIPVGVDAKVTDELTSRLQRPMMRNLIQTDIYNFSGIVGYFEQRTTNGVVEGINNKLKVLKRCIFGLRNFKSFEIRALLCWHFPATC